MLNIKDSIIKKLEKSGVISIVPDIEKKNKAVEEKKESKVIPSHLIQDISNEEEVKYYSYNIKEEKNVLKEQRENPLVSQLSQLAVEKKEIKIANPLENKYQNLQQNIQSLTEESLKLREDILSIKEKRFDLKVVKQELVEHKIFKEIKTLAQLQTFMSWHVFAVWDFMSLIKRLQQDLTCTTLPWMPNKFEEAARLVNDIVLGEETDVLPDGTGHISHFGLYVLAMKEVNADTSEIERFIKALQEGKNVNELLEKLPPSVEKFVKFTLNIAMNKSLYSVLGSFFYGRENVIPDMFTALLNNWNIKKEDAPMFVYYLERHIELDSGEHGPASERIIDITTEEDPEKILEVLNAAIDSVKMRIELWDGIYEIIKEKI